VKSTTMILWTTAMLILSIASPTSALEPRADGERLIALCEEHCEAFDLIHGNSMYYGGGADQAREVLKTLQEVEQNVLPEVQPVLVRFVESYGTTAMEVSNYFHRAGIELDGNVGNRFDDLYRGVTNVEKSRRASAEGIARRADMDLGGMDRYGPDIRLRKMREAKELLLIGQQMDPANADINAMLATIDADISDAAEAMEKEIDDATWAGNIASFNGPGTTVALAKSAVEFFRSHPNWTGDSSKGVEILDVAVRGEWAVAETDVFGRPISWRLPIHLAITDAELRSAGLARVYELSVVTRQGNPGATAKAPPFGGYWVGNSWKMRLGKL